MSGHGGYRMNADTQAEIDRLIPVATQIAQLEHGILEVRAEQRALELQRDDAVSLEHRLLNEVDVARRLQARCDQQIEERARAISSLQDEISALVPKQRQS